MAFCVNIEAIHRWSLSTMSKARNCPRGFRSGHVLNVLELLNLIISTCFSNYFRRHPVTAFANILEQGLDSTNTRHTQLYIHVAVEHGHQLRVVSSNPRVVNLLLRVPAHGSRCCFTSFFWTLSSVRYVVLAFRLLPLGSKSLGRVLLASRSSMQTGAGLCDQHGLRIMC